MVRGPSSKHIGPWSTDIEPWLVGLGSGVTGAGCWIWSIGSRGRGVGSRCLRFGPGADDGRFICVRCGALQLICYAGCIDPIKVPFKQKVHE